MVKKTFHYIEKLQELRNPSQNSAMNNLRGFYFNVWAILLGTLLSVACSAEASFDAKPIEQSLVWRKDSAPNVASYTRINFPSHVLKKVWKFGTEARQNCARALHKFLEYLYRGWFSILIGVYQSYDDFFLKNVLQWINFQNHCRFSSIPTPELQLSNHRFFPRFLF